MKRESFVHSGGGRCILDLPLYCTIILAVRDQSFGFQSCFICCIFKVDQSIHRQTIFFQTSTFQQHLSSSCLSSAQMQTTIRKRIKLSLIILVKKMWMNPEHPTSYQIPRIFMLTPLDCLDNLCNFLGNFWSCFANVFFLGCERVIGESMENN